MTMNEFLKETAKSSLLLLECGNIAVYDRSKHILYTSEDIHNHANMNSLADFRTMIGHHLLWSRQREVSCENKELFAMVSERPRTLYKTTEKWNIWELSDLV